MSHRKIVEEGLFWNKRTEQTFISVFKIKEESFRELSKHSKAAVSTALSIGTECALEELAPLNIQGDGECGRQLNERCKGDLEACAKDLCNQQAFARDCALLCHGSLRAVSAKEGLRFKDFAQRCGRKVIPAATAAFITSVVTSVEHVGALMPFMFRSSWSAEQAARCTAILP